MKLKLLLLTILFSAGLASAATVVAKKSGVKVLSEPKNSAEVLATLQKDDHLPVDKRVGMYWKVKAEGGKDGYVSVLKVKHKAGGSASLSNALRKTVKEGRNSDEAANARARSTVMGVRGLDETEEALAAGNARANLRLVYAMEDYSVSEKQLDSLANRLSNEIEATMARSAE